MTATFEDMITAFRETDEEVAKKLEEDKDVAFLAPLYRLCSEKKIALLKIYNKENELETDLSEEKWLTEFRYEVKMKELLKQLSIEQLEKAYMFYSAEPYEMGIEGYSDDYLDDALDALTDDCIDELDALLGEE